MAMTTLYPFNGTMLTVKEVMRGVPVLSERAIRLYLQAGCKNVVEMMQRDAQSRAKQLAGAKRGGAKLRSQSWKSTGYS